MTRLENVPTIDLRRFDTDRAACVAEVGAAFRQFGFCCFSHHGIPDSLIASAYDAFKAFFRLPVDQKMAYRAASGGARGYTPFKVETAKDQTIADLKEFWHVGREADPAYPNMLPNVWPQEIAGFRAEATELYQAFDRCADRILALMAAHIGLPDDYFRSVVAGGDSILRVLHYPPVDPADLPAVRAAAHEDIDLITLLVATTDSGLELLTAEGTWLPIQARENTLVVNAGDMLQRLTNHVYRSTTHRVVNPKLAAGQASGPRYSMPFFVHPRPSFTIDVLPTCVTADNPTRYPEPITAQDYLDIRLKEIKLS